MSLSSFQPEAGWSHAIINALGIEPWRIPIVVASAVGIYCVFFLLVRTFGSRVLADWRVGQTLVVVMFGAVAGRVIIGHPPTLAAGAIGLCTLVGLELVVGGLYRTRTGRQVLDTPPVLVVSHGTYLKSPAARVGITLTDVHAAARKAGIGSMRDVQAIVVEPTGSLSVFKEGVTIDEEIMHGVKGAYRLFQKPHLHPQHPHP